MGCPWEAPQQGGCQDAPETLPIGPRLWSKEQLPLGGPSSKEQGFVHLSGRVVTVPGREAEHSVLFLLQPNLIIGTCDG